MKNKSIIKIGICADIHKDIMHDAEDRLKVFLENMKNNEVDFIIDLGDFCHPVEKNKGFLNIWNNYEGDKYHVLGNHDMDHCDKTETMEFLGMKKSYYSFDYGDFHFIVLDTNYIEIDNQYIDYANGNFYRYPNNRTNLSTEQLIWLEKDIRNTDKYIILFSHASLENPEIGIRNQKQLQNILNKENKRVGYQKIVASINGHDHLDYYRKINGIHYIDLNSMSNQWLGSGYECIRYSKEIHDKYPSLKYVVPYKDPLYAVVTLDSNGVIIIDGIESEFVGLSPLELGHSDKITGRKITPVITSRKLYFETKKNKKK